jgi:hypothetical protein
MPLAAQQGVPSDAGVRDQHLHRAVRLLDLRERGLDGVRVGHVAAHAERSLRGLAAAVRDRHLVAGRHERLGDRPADPAVATGDQYGSAHLGVPAKA